MEITTQRSVASGVRATLLGLITMSFDVVPVRRPNSSKDGAFKLVTKDLEPVRQKYVTETGDLHDQFDLVKAREVDGVFVQATPEEIAAAKTGTLEANVIEFTAHRAAEVDESTRPGEKQYRLRPSRNSKKVIGAAEANLYATIRELVLQETGVVFVGALRLRDNRAVYRLDVWGGQLVLSELIVEDDLAERDVIVGDVNVKQVDLAAALLESTVEPWDPSVHRWDVEQAVSDLVAAKAEGTVVSKPAAVVQPVDDLMATLAAAVEQAQKDKVPA